MSERKTITQLPRFGSMTQPIRERVRRLYQTSQEAARCEQTLSQAFEELETTLEALGVVEEQLFACNAVLLSEQSDLEQEFQQYRELFFQAPAGYLVTGLDGTIRKANVRAERLLGVIERNLVGRALANFVLKGQRRAFRMTIAALRDEQDGQMWQISFLSSEAPPFYAYVWAAAGYGPSGRPQSLRWLMMKIPNSSSETGMEG